MDLQPIQNVFLPLTQRHSGIGSSFEQEYVRKIGGSKTSPWGTPARTRFFICSTFCIPDATNQAHDNLHLVRVKVAGADLRTKGLDNALMQLLSNTVPHMLFMILINFKECYSLTKGKSQIPGLRSVGRQR